MFSFFPANGFLGTGATFEADLTLVVQLIMGIALILGAVLARRKCYKAHSICQTAVLVLNLIMIALVMLPSFRVQVAPALPHVFRKRYYTVAAVHGLLGVAAEILGLYIAAVAGTRLVPERLRFSRWKPWMRAELMLWWIVLLGGIATYYVWYIAPVS
jgi:uncharacterized membrane protein YozB (DUF420 family)